MMPWRGCQASRPMRCSGPRSLARLLCRAPTDAGGHCCRRRSARPAREVLSGKYRPAAHCPDAWESEDFFPTFGATGSWLSFSAAPIRDGDGAVIGCIETLQDITERKVAESARRESERRLIDIVAGSPVATFVLDADCRVTHWNSACETLTNTAAQEVLGSNDAWRAFYPYDTRAWCWRK
ncbi:MAG: PAS domain-containing protein [Sulfuritalea sp.]|nr:PAS domain-containing protein [Sulfuritalea sp.]